MNEDELIGMIELAFDGIERPMTSLRQFRLTDEFGMSREITDKEWILAGEARVDSEWRKIPDSEIEDCDCLLAHMGADEFRYFLPAYMRYSVKHHQKPIWETDVLGMTVSSLSPSSASKDLYAYMIAQFASLDSAQKFSIVQFLKFVANMEEDVRRPDALKALDRYWAKGNVGA